LTCRPTPTVVPGVRFVAQPSPAQVMVVLASVHFMPQLEAIEVTAGSVHEICHLPVCVTEVTCTWAV
jgi:hypothetical protein